MHAGFSLLCFVSQYQKLWSCIYYDVGSLAGMSRSVTVAVAYIMSVTSLNWKEALKVVRVGRAVANPNFGFQKQLQEFETSKLAEVSF